MDPDRTEGEPLAPCAVCHRDVPPAHLVCLSGRVQCLACAAAWFDDEYDDDDEDEGAD
jgi:hypothetical protein